ncbi:hypothetical protein CEXT_187551 [Caerostris extrusa]|uniref:Uncharacterized protein n=1 Tax=Caerostris extrusa TaxID=172846 RepID=A0AAV4WW93_CAEEX|nr:hypothetical protein CEXT_187551 [Caerostris extrusa]
MIIKLTDPAILIFLGPKCGWGGSSGILGGVNGDPPEGGGTSGYFVKYPSPHPARRQLHQTPTRLMLSCTPSNLPQN